MNHRDPAGGRMVVRRPGCPMKQTCTYRTATSMLLIALIVLHGGCSTFQALEPGMNIADIDPQDQGLRIAAADGYRYDFPAGQYRFESQADSIWTCVGWGEQYGTFGLTGMGFYTVPLGSGTVVEVERIDAVRSVIFTGIISGATIVAFLGIRHLSSSSDKGGGNSQPPVVN